MQEVADIKAAPAEAYAKQLSDTLVNIVGPHSEEHGIIVLGMAIGKLMRRLSPRARREMRLIVSHELAKATRGW